MMNRCMMSNIDKLILSLKTKQILASLLRYIKCKAFVSN